MREFLFLNGFSVFSRFFNRVHPEGGESQYRIEENLYVRKKRSRNGDALAQDDNAESKHHNFSPFLMKPHKKQIRHRIDKLLNSEDIFFLIILGCLFVFLGVSFSFFGNWFLSAFLVYMGVTVELFVCALLICGLF
jgi:hypothetical protein